MRSILPLVSVPDISIEEIQESWNQTQRQEALRNVTESLQASKATIDDKIKELDKDIKRRLTDPGTLRKAAKSRFDWFNEPPVPLYEEEEMLAACLGRVIWRPLFVWVYLRGLQTSLKHVLDELKKYNFEEMNVELFYHHSKEVHGIIQFCWRQLNGLFDPISNAVEETADRGDERSYNAFWTAACELDREQLRHQDFAVWALLQLRPDSFVHLKPVLTEVVNRFRNDPEEQTKFLQPDFLDILQCLEVAKVSLEAVVILQALTEEQDHLGCDPNSEKCLHEFQYTWMRRFSESDAYLDETAIGEVKVLIRLTADDEPASDLPLPEEGLVAKVVVLALERLRRSAGTRFFAIRELIIDLERLAGMRSTTKRTHPKSRKLQLKQSDQDDNESDLRAVGTVNEHRTAADKDNVEDGCIVETEQTARPNEQLPHLGPDDAKPGRLRHESNKENVLLETEQKPALLSPASELGNVASEYVPESSTGEHPLPILPAPSQKKGHRKRTKCSARKTKGVKVFHDADDAWSQAESNEPRPSRSRSRRDRTFIYAGTTVQVQRRTMKFEDHDAYDTLRRVMRAIGDNAKRTRVRWSAFERMMTLPPLNFSAVPIDGSRVSFTRRDPERGKESVVIHSPHPGSWLEPYVLKDFQRRFGRVMQMESDDFEGPD